MSIRIGIAGFGKHALGRILPIIEADERLELAAVWTRSEATQHLLRERGLTGITGDFESFLSRAMDVVYVASPTGLHFQHAAAVLEAGLHAWVEKPIAARPEDVRSLVSQAERANLMLAEAFMFAWHPQAEAIGRALADGSVGALRSASLTFCFPHLDADNFRYDPALGGGAFLDHACYLVKALDVYLPGEWTILGGCLDQAGFAVDVSGAAQLRRDADGVVATLDWGFGRSYVNEIRLVGERGRMVVQSAFTKPASRSCGILMEDSQGRESLLEVKAEDPYRGMIEGFMGQYGTPDCWPGLRQDILRHAERFFALRSMLKHYR